MKKNTLIIEKPFEIKNFSDARIPLTPISDFP